MLLVYKYIYVYMIYSYLVNKFIVIHLNTNCEDVRTMFMTKQMCRLCYKYVTYLNT